MDQLRNVWQQEHVFGDTRNKATNRNGLDDRQVHINLLGTTALRTHTCKLFAGTATLKQEHRMRKLANRHHIAESRLTIPLSRLNLRLNSGNVSETC